MSSLSSSSSWVLAMFIVVLVVGCTCPSDAAVIQSFSFGSTSYNPDLYLAVTVDTPFATGLDMNMTFKVNNVALVSIIVSSINHYNGNTNLLLRTGIYIDGNTPPNMIQGMFVGNNTFDLYQVDGGIVMSQTMIFSLFFPTRYLYVYDIQPPQFISYESVSYNGNQLYNIVGSGCQVELKIRATDDFYGVSFASFTGTSKDFPLYPISGTRLNGVFQSTTTMFFSGTQSTLYLYDGIGNRGSYALNPPLVCNSLDLSWLDDSTIFQQLAPPTLQYQRTIIDPFLVTALVFQNTSAPYGYDTVNTVKLNPYTWISPNSNLFIFNKFIIGSTYTLSIINGQASITKNLDNVVSPSPSEGFTTPTITSGSISDPVPGSLYYNWGPNTRSKFFGKRVLLLELVMVNPINITFLQLHSGDTDSTPPVFVDNDVMASIHDGSKYSRWITVETDDEINTQYLIYYFTMTAGHFFGSMVVNVSPVVSEPIYYPLGSNLFTLTPANMTSNKQLQTLTRFDLPYHNLSLPLIPKIYLKSDDQVMWYEFPRSFKKVSPRNGNQTIVEIFTTLPRQASSISKKSISGYVDEYTNFFLEPGMDNSNPPLGAIQLKTFTQNKTHLIFNMENNQGSGFAMCLFQKQEIYVGIENVTQASSDFSQFTITLLKSKITGPNCKSELYIKCYDREYQSSILTKPDGLYKIDCPVRSFIPVHIRSRHSSQTSISFEVMYRTTDPVPNPSVVLGLYDPTGSVSSDSVSLTLNPSTNGELRTIGGVWNIPSTLQKVVNYQFTLLFSNTTYSETYSNLELQDLKNSVISTEYFGLYLSSTSVKAVPNNAVESLAPLITTFDASYANNQITISLSSNDPNGIYTFDFVYASDINPTPVVKSVVNYNNSPNMTFTYPIVSITTSHCGVYQAYFYVTNVCDRIGNCKEYNYFDFAKSLVINDGTFLTLIPSVTLDSFSMSPKIIYPFSDNDNDRKVTVTIKVTRTVDFEPDYKPIFYVNDIYDWMKPFQYPFVVSSTTSPTTTYTVDAIIPKYVGYANLSISIYGIGDLCGNYIGYSQLDLLALDPTNHIQIKTCPNDCSGNGQCQGSTCKCNSGYTGADCLTNIACIDGNGTLCSGRGQCLLSGFCSCNSWYTGSVCQEKIDFYPPYNISFEPNSPWCKYSINGTYSNVSDPYSFENNNQFTFDIKFFSVVEVDVNDNVVREEVFRDMIRVGTPTNFTMSKQLQQDNSSLTASMFIAADSSALVNWLGEDIRIPRNAVKYSMTLEGYKFKHPLNSLMVIWDLTSSSSFQQTAECGQQSNQLQFGGNPNSFSYIKWPFYNYQLYARFPTRGFSDGDIIVVNNRYINSTLLDNNMYRVFLATEIPHFFTKTNIDPDFSVLIQDFNPNDNCKSNSKDDGVNKALIIGVVVGVVGFALVVVMIVLVIKKLGKTSKFIWLRKASLKMKNITTHK